MLQLLQSTAAQTSVSMVYRPLRNVSIAHATSPRRAGVHLIKLFSLLQNMLS